MREILNAFIELIKLALTMVAIFIVPIAIVVVIMVVIAAIFYGTIAFVILTVAKWFGVIKLLGVLACPP